MFRGEPFAPHGFDLWCVCIMAEFWIHACIYKLIRDFIVSPESMLPSHLLVMISPKHPRCAVLRLVA